MRGPNDDSPLVLAIETSTKLLGVALCTSHNVLYEHIVVKPRVHSSMLLPLCMYGLRTYGVEAQDLLGIAVSGGPGSFTGLRIGCATAQGLAFGWRKKVALVDEFKVLLEQNAALDRVACVMGKARGQTVSAYFCKDNTEDMRFTELVPTGPRSIEELFTEITDNEGLSGIVHVVGDAAKEFCDFAGNGFIPVLEYNALPRPGVLGMIGARMLEQDMGKEARDVVPVYYRRSQAEVLFQKKTRGRR
jgi:tRNA threonylcarbamoyladenosine biosynthesis protein TsaB